MIKVSYEKKLPIPGTNGKTFANETYRAEMEIETENPEPASWASCFAEVRAAVNAEFSAHGSEMSAQGPKKAPEKEKNRPAWMTKEGEPKEDLQEASEWVSEFAGQYENLPDHLGAPTVGQIAYIENLMHDKKIPDQDEKADEYFRMLERGIMDETSAGNCIDYLKTFKWKPEHQQRGYDLKNKTKRGPVK